MKAVLYKLSSNKVSEKKISNLRLFSVFVSFLFFNIISVEILPQESEILLKSTYFDHMGEYLNRNIIRTDINNDGNTELITMVSDSIIICFFDSIKYFKAFNANISSEIIRWQVNTWRNPLINEFIFTSGITSDFQYPWSLLNPISGERLFGEFYFMEIQTITTHPEGTLWYVKRDMDSVMILRTTNFNIGSEYITNIGANDPNIDFSRSGIYSHTPVYTSYDGRYISTITMSDGFFTSGNPGGIYRYFSSDFGQSWQGEIIARGSKNNLEFGQISNRNIAPYFASVSEYSGVVDDSGVLHLAVFGIGCTISGNDTTEYTPILYWNSKDRNWTAISNPEIEPLVDSNGNNLIVLAPMFTYGQSLPSISVSRNGEAVLVGWVSPEYTEIQGNLILNIYPGDGGEYSKPIYYTDLLTNISLDGGMTWSIPNITPLKNSFSKSETFLCYADYLDYYSNGGVKAEFIYFIDSIPGNSYYDQNGLGKMNPFYYDTFIYGEVPVELISFTAEVVNHTVNLKWSTASELNNRGFEVERRQVFSQQSSVSNLEWNTIGFVDGNGTQSQTHNYSFIDTTVSAGRYSYRLKQIDFDGSFTYSNVVEVDLSLPLTFSLEQNFPNPFNPTTKIRYTVGDAYYASPTRVLLRIYNILGSEVATLVNEDKPAGSYEILFDASQLASGVYFYSLNAGEFKMTKKMLVLK